MNRHRIKIERDRKIPKPIALIPNEIDEEALAKTIREFQSKDNAGACFIIWDEKFLHEEMRRYGLNPESDFPD